jgi:hypothetical protein
MTAFHRLRQRAGVGLLCALNWKEWFIIKARHEIQGCVHFSEGQCLNIGRMIKNMRILLSFCTLSLSCSWIFGLYGNSVKYSLLTMDRITHYISNNEWQ